MNRRLFLSAVLLSVLVLVSVAAAGAQTCCPTPTASPSPAWEAIQNFPSGGCPSGQPNCKRTSWKVHFAHASGKGLYITGAWFKKTATSSWMRILYDARVSEIFVPYHPGSPRYFDLSNFNFPLVQATAADAGCCGQILNGVVIKEVRDRGIHWKNDTQGRRGEEMILWATLDSANYNYVFQYGFRDDGTITFRLGATAANLPGMELIAHMHNALWRVDIDLNGWANDKPFSTGHNETTASSSATDSKALFNGGIEGWANWNDLNFSGLRIKDNVTVNGQNHLIGYDLMPLRRGTPRHKEAITHHDFWVSRYKWNEVRYRNVTQYVSDTQNINAKDIVLWHMSGAHHMPRDEDGRKVNGTWNGVALLMWSGFDLRPRNLFDGTPFYP